MKLSHTALAMLVALSVCSVAGVAIAQTTDDGGMFVFEENDGLIPDWLTTDSITNTAKRTAYGFGLGTDDQTAVDHAQRAEEELLANEQAFVEYANTHVPSDANKTNYDSFKICFEKDDTTAVRYLESPVTNNTYQDLTVDQTGNQTVDRTITFDGYQTTVADDIVAHVHSEYVATDTAPDMGLVGYLGGQLGKDFRENSVEQGDVAC